MFSEQNKQTDLVDQLTVEAAKPEALRTARDHDMKSPAAEPWVLRRRAKLL
jgi:hypothetical protein